MSTASESLSTYNLTSPNIKPSDTNSQQLIMTPSSQQDNGSLVMRVTSPAILSPEKSKKSVDINPTFLLRGIDPGEILKTYLDGGYSNMMIPGTKAAVVQDTVTADREVGETPESEVYEYFGRSNNRCRVITTNHKKYAMVRDGLQIDTTNDIPAGGICQWCRRNFDHNPVGVPIKVERLRDQVMVYHVEGIYCTYECCFSRIKTKTQCPMMIREPHYKDSETMLRTMFHSVYPDQRLRDSPDWILLDCNGGPLSEKDFFSEHHVYRSTPNIIYIPLKLEYIVGKRI